MTIGIERFRDIGRGKDALDSLDSETLKDKRITIGDDQETVRAPSSRFGRFVDWIKGKSVSEERSVENKTARQTFYDALVKADDKALVDKAIKDNWGLTADQFVEKGTSLTAYRVKRVLDAVDGLRGQYTMQATNKINAFVDNGNLGTVMHAVAKEQGHPGIAGNDRDLVNAFWERARTHPDFGHRSFSETEMNEFAHQAANDCLEVKKERFQTQHPDLAELGHFPDHATFFKEARDSLGKEPLVNAPEDFRTLSDLTLEQIEYTDTCLAKMSFDPGKAKELKAEVSRQMAGLLALEGELDETNLVGQDTGAARTLRDAMQGSLDGQIKKLSAKLDFLDEYLQNDPLSEKSVAYNQLVWRQAALVGVQDLVRELEATGADEDTMAMARQKQTEAEGLVRQAKVVWEGAGVERSPDPGTRLKAQKSEAEDFLKQCETDLGTKAPGSLEKMRVKALDTLQDWNVIDRKIVVNRDGVTGTYRSVIKPGPTMGGSVGAGYENDGLKGVSAGNKLEGQQVRNLHVSELRKVNSDGSEKVLSQTIQHGTLDPYGMGSAEDRLDASKRGARKVVEAAIEANPEFKQEALRRKNEGGQPSTLVHINNSLMTADDHFVRKFFKSFREREFTENQFAGFESLNGGQTALTVRNQNGEDEEINVKTDTITFSWGVNAVAMRHGIWATGTEDTMFGPLEKHNRENMEKLVGNLTPLTSVGGHIGGLVDRLKEQAAALEPNSTDRREIEKLIGQIGVKTDSARSLFESGDYKRGIDDAYKMQRTVDALVDLGRQAIDRLEDKGMLMSKSDNCKSGKDRTGMADVETKADAIITDLGGEVHANEKFSPQDQAIYNTVLTSAGRLEVQQFNTGFAGSKNAGELKARINDPDALKYAQGFQSFAKA